MHRPTHTLLDAEVDDVLQFFERLGSQGQPSKESQIHVDLFERLAIAQGFHCTTDEDWRGQPTHFRDACGTVRLNIEINFGDISGRCEDKNNLADQPPICIGLYMQGS
jgi:hypothetical protein